MAGRRRLTDRLVGLIWPPVSHRAVKAEVVGRLEDLHEARDQLSDEEFADERSAALAGLARNRHREGAVAVTFGAAAGALAAVAGFLIWTGSVVWGAGAAAAAAPAGVVGVRMYRFWSARRRLPIEDRLAVVAELARVGVLTAAEATALRDQIDQLGRDRPALRRRPGDGPGESWVSASGPLAGFPALPPPPPLRQPLYVHFWSGSEEFELVASAAAVRTVACPWPDGEWAGRKLAWLHCRGTRLSDLRPERPGLAKVTFFVIPAHYITEARAWAGPGLPPEGPGDFMGIYPPNQPPPIITVPLDELKRLVTGLVDQTSN